MYAICMQNRLMHVWLYTESNKKVAATGLNNVAQCEVSKSGKRSYANEETRIRLHNLSSASSRATLIKRRLM